MEKPFAELRLALEIMFEGVEGAGHIPVVSARSPPEVSNGNLTASSKIEGAEAVRIGEIVTVSYMPGNARKGSQDHVVLEWEGGAIGDIVADAVVAVILQVVQPYIMFTNVSKECHCPGNVLEDCPGADNFTFVPARQLASLRMWLKQIKTGGTRCFLAMQRPLQKLS